MKSCVKCGGTNIALQWRHEAVRDINKLQAKVVPEHLEAKCLLCGYTWHEKPLDQLKEMIRHQKPPQSRHTYYIQMRHYNNFDKIWTKRVELTEDEARAHKHFAEVFNVAFGQLVYFGRSKLDSYDMEVLE